MIVRSWMTDLEESNVHLLACEQTREAAIIDAGGWPDAMRDEIARLGLRVTHVLITHTHHDHIDALDRITAAHPGAQVVASVRVAPRTRIVCEGDEIAVGKLCGRVVQTSGHTPESISFVFERSGIAFTGDALFAGSVGGTKSDALRDEQLRHVREKILSLPGDCEVRCGHGPATTVDVEKSANPFFR